MASWSEFEGAEPAFAAAARERLDSGVHKTIATLRADGSPRISGIETFSAEGDIWIGSMPDAVKARDLQRDPRFALHGPPHDPDPDDPTKWPGEAKLSGRAVEITDPTERARVFALRHPGEESPETPGESHLFRVDIDDVVITRLNDAGDRLVIEHWNAGRGLNVTDRA